MVAVEPGRFRQQAGLGRRRAARQAPYLRQSRGPRQRHATTSRQLADWISSQFDTSLSWKDLDWIRSIWPGKLILKGILDVEDAELAAKTGAQAIVVSNHGGRQLDGAPSSIEVLPEIVDAVGSQMEIMFDGGIRSGRTWCARSRSAPNPA